MIHKVSEEDEERKKEKRNRRCLQESELAELTQRGNNGSCEIQVGKRESNNVGIATCDTLLIAKGQRGVPRWFHSQAIVKCNQSQLISQRKRLAGIGTPRDGSSILSAGH